MKIYINTMTPADLANIREAEIKAGAKENELTQDIAIIKGELFIPGEWKHLPDRFTVDANQYPYIKEAHVVLEERTAAVLKENGLHAFAQGLKEAAVTYQTAIPEIAVDVHKYAPYVESKEIG